MPSLPGRWFAALRRRIQRWLGDTRFSPGAAADRLPLGWFEYHLNPDGRAQIVHANATVRDFFQFGPDELPADSEKIFSRIHPDDIEQIVKSVSHSADNLTPWQQEYRLSLPDGSQRRITSHAVPHKEKEGRVIWQGFITDLPADTPVNEAQEKYVAHLESMVEQSGQALSLAKEAALCAERTKRSILSNVSHELRTPIHSIIGLSHLLARDTSDPAQRDKLDKLRNAAQQLLKMANSLIDLAELENRTLAIEKQRFTLGSLQLNLIRLLEPAYSNNAVARSFDIPPGVQAMPLIGAPLRLQQVLLTLIENACKFTEAGNITISVRIENEDNQNIRLAFAVRDTGIGMTPDIISRLFTPFEQGDASATRKHGGMGLGLALAQGLVRQMGGVIAVESQPGQGSCFSFTLAFEKAGA